MNETKIYKFTQILYEFLVVQKMNLQESLEIISKSSASKENKFIRVSACKISESLKNGDFLSTALKKCELIKFDNIYISFIRFAEITGNLNAIISFLKERCQRKKETKNTLIVSSAYPLFVIFLATISSIFLIFFSQYFLPNEQIFITKSQKIDILEGLVFLIFVCILVFYLLYKTLSENKIYEAFLAIGFLIKNGINMSLAFGYGVFILGNDTKEGKIFNLAKQRLEFGMDLKSAFGIGIEKKLKIKNFENALYYAEKGGNKVDIFEKIAGNMKLEIEQKRKLSLTFVEPLFVCITGLFLIVLVMNLFLPMLNNMGDFL